MSFQQLVAPEPDIPCKPGWCLQYVRQAFGAPIVEPTATAGWANADYKHPDWDFPAGCWVPVWFSLATEPAGHVALLAPDGSVYSTSHPTATTPTHHPSMADLLNAYARYNPLTYLGWSEDISGVRVVQDISIQLQGEIITPVQEDRFMPDLTEEEQRRILAASDMALDTPGRPNPARILNSVDGGYIVALLEGISGQVGNTLNKEDGGYIVGLVSALKPGAVDATAIADAVVSAVGTNVAGKVLKALGEKLGAA